jgi:hypothetical protein
LSYGKGVYGFLTGCKGQALRVLQKIFLAFSSFFGREYFIAKTLTALNPTPLLPMKHTRPRRRTTHKKKVINYEKYRKNKKTLLPQLKTHHKNGVVSGDCRADIRVGGFVFRYNGSLSRIQGFKACIAIFRACYGSGLYRHFDLCVDYNYHVINILNLSYMSKVFLLGANTSYDANKQAVEKNQIIQMNGYKDDRYVVYDVVSSRWGLLYKLINLRTKRFGQCDLIRPLSQKFGIGYYFDDENLQLMDAFEVAILRSEAEQNAQAEQDAKQQQHERDEQLKATGRERLANLVPADAKAVIVAELHEDDSEPMTDYFGYHTVRTVILGFSNHTKDLFSEMRKYAVNFPETAHLAGGDKKYEQREKYTGGSGYYLGEGKYGGWVVKKERCHRDSIIERFALTAGDEANICVSRVQVQAETNDIPDAVNKGDFIVADYSEKALAVFGDTRLIKDQLKALGGRFNPKLTRRDKESRLDFLKVQRTGIK